MPKWLSLKGRQIRKKVFLTRHTLTTERRIRQSEQTLVPTCFLLLGPIIQTRFLELAVYLHDFSSWLPLGTFSNLLLDYAVFFVFVFVFCLTNNHPFSQKNWQRRGSLRSTFAPLESIPWQIWTLVANDEHLYLLSNTCSFLQDFQEFTKILLSEYVLIDHD